MGASIWQLLIILAIVLVLFGAKRLRSLGTDLGASIKGFREAMKDGEKEHDEASAQSATNEAGQNRVIDGEVVKEKDKV